MSKPGRLKHRKFLQDAKIESLNKGLQRWTPEEVMCGLRPNDNMETTVQRSGR
jgi:hypothetical protein